MDAPGTSSARPDVRRRLQIGAVSVVVLAYGWWFTDREPFSDLALRALLAAVVALILIAQVHRRRAASTPRGETRQIPGFRLAAAVWIAVTGAVVAWELIALRSLPRKAHPTISSIVESVEQYHLARLALYAAWIGLGWAIAS